MEIDFPSHFSDDSGHNALVIWTSDSYNFQYFHKIGNDVIRVDELVCDALYFN